MVLTAGKILRGAWCADTIRSGLDPNRRMNLDESKQEEPAAPGAAEAGAPNDQAKRPEPDEERRPVLSELQRTDPFDKSWAQADRDGDLGHF